MKANQCRNRPLAQSARRYKGVIGESKEGIGGTRNPPCPPWPPEAPKIRGLLNAELVNENQTLEIIERLTQGEYKSASKERSKKRRERTPKTACHIQRTSARKRSPLSIASNWLSKVPQKNAYRLKAIAKEWLTPCLTITPLNLPVNSQPSVI